MCFVLKSKITEMFTRAFIEQGKQIQLMQKHYNSIIKDQIAETYARSKPHIPDICTVELVKRQDVGDDTDFLTYLNVLFTDFGFVNCYIIYNGRQSKVTVSELLDVRRVDIMKFGFSFWFEKPNAHIEQIIKNDTDDEHPVIQAKDGTTCETPE